jgi:hypothetical protein
VMNPNNQRFVLLTLSIPVCVCCNVILLFFVYIKL